MRAIPFPQANKVLRAPPSRRSEIQEQLDALREGGADVAELQAKLDAVFPPEQEVYDLPVWGGEVEGVERCISCWEPSPEERALIAAGCSVWLWVVGHTHPPLVLDAAHPFEEPRKPEPRREGGPPADRILLRLPAQRDDLHDIAEEYAIVAIDVPPGVMLWGRVEDRWFANPSGREVIRQLLARSAVSVDPSPTEEAPGDGLCYLCHLPWPHAHSEEQLGDWVKQGGEVGVSSEKVTVERLVPSWQAQDWPAAVALYMEALRKAGLPAPEFVYEEIPQPDATDPDKDRTLLRFTLTPENAPPDPVVVPPELDEEFAP